MRGEGGNDNTPGLRQSGVIKRQDKANTRKYKDRVVEPCKNHTCPTSFYYKLNTNEYG